MADSSVLLSTCAASGATLVAIVGGLVASRYVSLESERQSAERRHSDLAARLQEARRSREEAEAALMTYDIEWALDDEDVYELLIDYHSKKAQGPTPLPTADLRSVVDLDEFEDSAIARVFAKMADDAENALTTLIPKIPRAKEQSSWRDFKLGKAFPIAYDEIWEHVYDKIVRHVRREIEKEEAASKPPPLADFFQYGLPSVDVSMLVPSRIKPRGERPRLQRHVDSARADAAALEAELGIAAENLQRTVNPRSLVMSLAMLVYLAVVTLVVPLLFLTPKPANLSGEASAWFLATFLSGVLALFVYLFWDAVRLVKPPLGPTDALRTASGQPGATS